MKWPLSQLSEPDTHNIVIVGDAEGKPFYMAHKIVEHIIAKWKEPVVVYGPARAGERINRWRSPELTAAVMEKRAAVIEIDKDSTYTLDTRELLSADGRSAIACAFDPHTRDWLVVK